ncbi:hypothetical protein E5676_scaffold66G00060 [Cucumis melo var. makuwa]|uniref:Uncharacterized protein n=1 Tax=Cucumis melo var. makuwa TaxID=1194695 RepID=A0A5D3CKZ9_CUCMM|nr:hypothetical protein E5676_scaffold66G00060 [Cucumis melo var. makuwa]
MLVENEIVLCLDSLGPYMNGSEFKKDYPTLQFENDKDGGKMLFERDTSWKVALHKKKPANNNSPESCSLYEFPFAFQPEPTRQYRPSVGGLPIGSYHLRYHASCDGVDTLIWVEGG